MRARDPVASATNLPNAGRLGEVMRRWPQFLSTMGLNVDDFEWENERLTKYEWRELMKRVKNTGRMIQSDFRKAARERMEAIESAMRKDAERAKEEGRREAAHKDFAENIVFAQRMVERIAPSLEQANRAEERQLRKDIRKLQDKIQRHGQRVAREKFKRFKRR